MKPTQRVEKERKEYFFSFSFPIPWVGFEIGPCLLKKPTQKPTQWFGWVGFDPGRFVKMSGTDVIRVLQLYVAKHECKVI